MHRSFTAASIPFLQTGDVVAGKRVGASAPHNQTLNELGLKVSKLFQPPIVLITIAANIGDTALLTYPACFTDSVLGLTPTERRPLQVFWSSRCVERRSI